MYLQAGRSFWGVRIWKGVEASKEFHYLPQYFGIFILPMLASMNNAKHLLEQLEQSQNPEEQVNIIVDLTELFLNNDLQRCEEYAAMLLAIGETHEMPMAHMQHHLVMGRINYRKANLKTAFDHYCQANTFAVQINHLVAQASILELKGILHNKWGQHTEALQNMLAALTLYKERQVSNGLIGLCYNNIATTYDSLKQTDEAERYYRLAIETLEHSEKKQTIHFVMANLGLLLLNKKEYQQALPYFKNSLAAFVAANQIQAQGLAYHYMGQCYMGLKDHGSALELYQKALKLFKHSRYYHELSVIYTGLGTLYHELGGYSNAEVYYNKALEMRIKREFWNGACETYLSLHELYTTMGNETMAQDMIIDGLKLAEKQNLTPWVEKFKGLLV